MQNVLNSVQFVAEYNPKPMPGCVHARDHALYCSVKKRNMKSVIIGILTF